MVGTTRSRVSFFMNKFRRLGFIHYNDTLEIHNSLLNVVLHDSEPETEMGPVAPLRFVDRKPLASAGRGETTCNERSSGADSRRGLRPNF